MKKILLVVLLAVLVFSGCNNTALNMKQAEKKTMQEAKQNITFFKNNWVTANCSNDKGYYYMSSTALGDEQGEGMNLMYLDYESRKEMFLCNQPGCKHDSDACNSYVADVHMGDTVVLFINNNQLYMLVSPMDDSMSLETSWIDPEYEGMLTDLPDIQPRLYSMNLDGTGRKVLCEFDSGIVVEGAVAASEESIYVICKKTKSESIDNNSTYTSAYDRELICIDAATGKQKSICSLEQEPRLIGAFGKRLVFEALKFDREMTPQEIFNDEEYKEALKNATVSFSTLDVDACQTTQVLSVPGDEDFSSQVWGSKLYYSIKAEGQVKCMDLTDKSERVVADTPNSRIYEMYSDFIRLADWDVKNKDYTLLNLKTDEITALGLYIENWNTPINILAENQDDYLVIYDHECTGDYTTWAGTVQNDITAYKLALISKEDYLSSRPQYRAVETIGDGM